MTDVAKQLEQLQAEVARLNKMAKRTAEQKAVMAEMTEDEQKEYMEGDEAAREKLKAKYTKAKKAEGEDEEDEATTKALQKMQSQVDVALAKAEAIAAENAQMKLEKRANTELVGLAGDVASKVALLKALDGLNAGEREIAMDTLKKAADICVSFTKSAGTSGEPATSDATTKLDALAKAYATEHKVTQAQAYAKVLKTPEGGKLYAEANKQ